MKEEIEKLISEYKRRIRTVNELIQCRATNIKEGLDVEINKEAIDRLKTKRGCFNTFLRELQDIVNK